MKAIIESNRIIITVREIAKQSNVSHTTIENHIHIKRLGLVKKLERNLGPARIERSSPNTMDQYL